MTLRLLKNEFIKMVHEKKIYILLGIMFLILISSVYIYNTMKGYVLSNSSEAIKYSTSWKYQLSNMNSIIFIDNYATDFIFKSGIPFFVIFISIFSIDCFGDDFYSGNMKFFANSDTNKSSLFKAKVLYLIIICLSIVILNLILAFAISSIVFNMKFQGLFRSILIYLSSIIPVVSFSLIIGLCSLFIPNKSIRISVGVSLCILTGIIDRLINSTYFSPIGIIALIAKKQIENISFIDLFMCNFISFLYLILAFFIGKSIFKAIEFKY